MTVLILNPEELKTRFPQSSESDTLRVRLIVQTLRFDYESNHIAIRSMSCVTPSSVKVWLHNIGKYDSQVVKKGTVIDVTGYFNGEDVDAIEISALNGSELTQENISVLQTISHLP
ncbi:hypothetical protein PSN45_002544 [Yamadazyma tenuis]|uniref:OB domain-containing protein n=1 Tax=Candida tenuis (strain ATCC 10573 / BCRC 21748 / CBS 615 / JCM 9827 / NBRC 10315 / NRRL Y-1498 / VKM Y-70) TaxID=590646 RepID=G3B037_CANTC|nr:uncharacterized protein CANTEDRAFT_102627 [Yamadazyma tenuis ATCC 10573]EGV65306.1 hypothetical protein CANTEDRAFT_102627 [Yamadazyma tenuis ATCC 10573]WEJ95035.1 hypothetical protein PSN45_002544 [Yamadazyma tenuis]